MYLTNLTVVERDLGIPYHWILIAALIGIVVWAFGRKSTNRDLGSALKLAPFGSPTYTR